MKVPIRLTLITLEKISRSCGPCLPAVRCAQPIPAQQTEIRRPPSASAAASTAAWTGSSSVTSASTKRAALAELGGQRLALLGVEVGDHDRGAGARASAPRRRRAEPRGAARDQRALLPRSPSARQLIAGDPLSRQRPVSRTSLGFSHRAPVAGTRHRRKRSPSGSPRRASDPAADRAALRRAAQPRLLADPQPAGLGPRPHRQLRGALARADDRRPRAAARRARPLLRRDREPAQRPAASCRSCAATSCAPTWTRSASARSRCSTRSSSTTPTTRCCATASSTRCCSPTSTSTTRRCCSCCRWSTATSRSSGDPGRRASPSPTGPEMVARRGRRATRSARGRDGFAYDNERPRHTVELEPFEIDRTPVTNGAYAEFVADTGAEPPMYWERDGEGGWVTHRDGSTRRAVDPALPVIHVSWHEADAFAALGRQAAADRARVGGRGRAAPTASAPTSTSSPSAAPPAGAYARRAPPTAARCRCSATSGSGRPPTSRLPRLRGVPLPRVLGGLLRRRATRCCAAAPGRRAAT